jgi:hypothetical protein
VLANVFANLRNTQDLGAIGSHAKTRTVVHSASADCEDRPRKTGFALVERDRATVDFVPGGRLRPIRAEPSYLNSFVEGFDNWMFFTHWQS